MLIQVSGQAQLAKLKAAFAHAGDRGLREQMNKAGDRAGMAIERKVRANTDTYMPKGYEAVWKKALVIKVRSKLGTTRVITVTARGYGVKGHDRQAEELDAGEFRHPLFGRRRRLRSGRWMNNPWYSQKVRPGWFSEQARLAVPAAVAELDLGAAGVVKQIEASI